MKKYNKTLEKKLLNMEVSEENTTWLDEWFKDKIEYDIFIEKLILFWLVIILLITLWSYIYLNK